MSLSVREQQALDSIEHGLSGSDPRLALMLATFTRLTAGEEMSVREKIQAGRRQATRRSHGNRRLPLRDITGLQARRMRSRLGWQRAALLLWLLISIVLIAVALAVSRGSGGGSCAVSWASCAVHSPGHAARPATHKTAADQAPRISG